MERDKPQEQKNTVKRKKRKIHWPRFIIFITAVLLVVGLGVGSGLLFAWATDTPSFSPDDLDVHTTSILYDIHGNEFARLHGGENRTLVELDTIPQSVLDAFLAIEDNKFYEHHGVDFLAMIRAVMANITGGYGTQGASTITQQLVKNAFLTPDKKLKRKVQEAMLAFQLERTYSKDEIFQMYLNRIYFGEGAYGVQAAAHTFFGKPISEVGLHEAALLAAMPNAPNHWSPYRNPELAEQRRQLVLTQMNRFGYITAEEAEEAKQNQPTVVERGNRVGSASSNLYPYFVDYVIQETIEKYGISENLLYRGGLRIYTTVDPKVQRPAETSLSDSKNYPPSRGSQPVQASMAVIDHTTGQIRALVGGREHTAKRGFNRATDLKRQPGSAFKPVAVYAPALEMGRTTATVVDDVPVRYGNYEPDNYDGVYRGLITMREATQYSVNIYAVKLLNEIGVQNGYNFSKRLGIKSLDDKRDQVLGLSLGGLTHGTNPLEMAGAYGAFANKGVWIEPHAVTQILDREGNVYVQAKPKQDIVMKETSAYLMTSMLETVVQSGTGTRAQMNRPVAGKTGTTELPKDDPQFRGMRGNKDAWFAAYTPELVGVVWMGYDQTDRNNYLYQTYGGSYPAQIWRSVMTAALRDVPVKAFPRPRGLTEVAVDIKSGMLPSDLTPSQFIKTEIFDERTVPKETSNVWVEGVVCVDTGLPYTFGDDCEGGLTRAVFLQRPVPYTGAKRPLDAALEVPTPIVADEDADDADSNNTPDVPLRPNETPAVPTPAPATPSPSPAENNQQQQNSSSNSSGNSSPSQNDRNVPSVPAEPPASGNGKKDEEEKKQEADDVIERPLTPPAELF
ncbi:transglycosylase domain-containing protein [Heliorestis acidaminivorans]|uniref:transglycosylase domain-containing protein n=1 Tax=Heliorestis acidaminivorans TaxID=553427 RepID=UPI001478F17E|nr:penicillin-binding protein 1A [Heliorestis acidaminivorans]